MSPYIRSNLNVLTVFRVNSLLLLKSIHEELLSLSEEWGNFNEFKKYFVDFTKSTFKNGKLTRGFQALTCDLASGIVDFGTKTFAFDKNKKRKHDRTGDGRGKARKNEGARETTPEAGLQQEEDFGNMREDRFR